MHDAAIRAMFIFSLVKIVCPFYDIQRAAKSLLGVCETRAVSVCLSDPPHTAVNDLATVFRQPSHIVSLTLTPLPAEEDADKTSRAACHNTEPHRASSGLYQPPRPSPLSSPQQPKKRTKLSGKEMDKLLASLDEVGQSLARTQTQCEAIARRCEGKAREDTDTAAFSDEDSRVERLLKVAETLTTRIINQQQRLQPRRSPTPTTGWLSVCPCACVSVCSEGIRYLAIYTHVYTVWKDIHL